jgi:hypothetical protein
MAKKVKTKKLAPKRFYLGFELYATQGGKPRINTSFVPRTEYSRPDIYTEVDDREYGLKLDDENEIPLKKVTEAVREFAAHLISMGEIEK